MKLPTIDRIALHAEAEEVLVRAEIPCVEPEVREAMCSMFAIGYARGHESCSSMLAPAVEMCRRDMNSAITVAQVLMAQRERDRARIAELEAAQAKRTRFASVLRWLRRAGSAP
jgi:hypothetical protein